MTVKRKIVQGVASALVVLGCQSALAQTPEPAQVVGVQPDVLTTPVFTIGEAFDGYIPPGIPDGMAAYERENSMLILSSHELTASAGYPFTLANGTQLTGARVSALELDKHTREIITFVPAFDTIYNRAGEMVDEASDLDFKGLNRLCSAGSVVAGQAGFVDDILFTGEKTGGRYGILAGRRQRGNLGRPLDGPRSLGECRRAGTARYQQDSCSYGDRG